MLRAVCSVLIAVLIRLLSCLVCSTASPTFQVVLANTVVELWRSSLRGGLSPQRKMLVESFNQRTSNQNDWLAHVDTITSHRRTYLLRGILGAVMSVLRCRDH